jgi:hypothetical protein
MCEITFPVGEEITVGLCWFLSSIVGMIEIFLYSFLNDSKEFGRKKAT